MGQWDPANAGAIHLVETTACVARLQPRNPGHIAFATQTTLSIDDTRAIIEALQQRFPAIQGPRHDDICYATQNRQDAVRRLGQQCDLVLVVGSPNSSNSNRLRELAAKQGVPAYLIDGAADIRPEWLAGRERIGVTAGASAPESLVRDVIEHLRQAGAGGVRELDGEPEDVTFALPKELRLRVVA
jgi:4-hydroxy-3-methylbut-2-enyl diphosphate reductase